MWIYPRSVFCCDVFVISLLCRMEEISPLCVAKKKSKLCRDDNILYIFYFIETYNSACVNSVCRLYRYFRNQYVIVLVVQVRIVTEEKKIF